MPPTALWRKVWRSMRRPRPWPGSAPRLATATPPARREDHRPRQDARRADPRGGRTIIVVDEIPYQTLKSTIIEKVADVVKDGRIPDIADIQDHQRPQRHADRRRTQKRRRGRGRRQPALRVHAAAEHLQHHQHRADQPHAADADAADMLVFFLKHRKEVIRRRSWLS